VVQFVLRTLGLFAVAGIGLWFTLKRRARLGRAARPACWGFSLLIVYALARWALSVTSMIVQIEGGRPLTEMQTTLITINLFGALSYCVFLAALVCLMRAIFLDRNGGLAAEQAIQAA